MLYLKTQRQPNTSIRQEIEAIAEGNIDLADELMQLYGDKYGFSELPTEYTSKRGFVYFMKGEGFHGILSPVLGRYKIGMSNNPERRLVELNGEQAMCPISMVRYIEVHNMKEVEGLLHKKFKSNRKHGEWFDFNNAELIAVHLAYHGYQRDFKVNKLAQNKFPQKKLIFSSGVAVVALIATMGLLFSAIVPVQSQKPQQPEVEEIQ